MAKIITRSSLKDTWMLSCIEILKNGEKIVDQRGKETLEIRNLIMQTFSPLNYWQSVGSLWTPKDYFFSRDYLNTYAEQLLDPSEKGHVYDYGNRLRAHFGVDQIEEVIKKLKKDQTTRRAVAITIDPVIDNEQDEIPCLQQMTFLIRDSKLEISAFMRSNDVGMAAFANQYAFLHLGAYIGKALGVDVGKLTVHAVSAHINVTDIQAIKEVLSKNGWKF